jgi:hypothetical protein
MCVGKEFSVNILSKLLKKSTIISLLAIVLVGSFFVYAYVDRTVYTTQQLVIIPGKVTSDSWLGLESVLVQDISEYSLYQDFTEKNSAYISELGLFSAQVSPDAPTPDNPNEVSVDGDESVDGNENTDISVSSDTSSEDSTDTTTNIEPEAPAESPEAQPEREAPSEPAVESSEPVSVDGAGQRVAWGVFPKTTARYKLAQGIVEEEVTPSENNSSEAEPAAFEESVITETENESSEAAPESNDPNSIVDETNSITQENEQEATDGLSEEGASTTETNETQLPDETQEVAEDTSNDYVLAAQHAVL